MPGEKVPVDGVVLKGKTSLKDIKGQKVNLVQLSVSHYLLARGLSTGSDLEYADETTLTRALEGRQTV